MTKQLEVYKFQSYTQRLGHDISGVRPVMIPDDDGDWVDRHTAEHLVYMLQQAGKRIAELEASQLAVKLTTPATPLDAAAAIRACMDEFPDAVQDIVEECAVIAENTVIPPGGTVQGDE